jgi:ATP-dependent helicase HepA
MAEPELGLGIVVETVKGRVRLDYPAAGETRLYAIETAPLRRVTFKEGDTVIDLEGQSMVIERVFENNGVLIYFGKTRVLPESELGNMTLKHGADDRLLLGEVDSPRQFALRRRTLQNDHNRRISPINGFLGGRIDLIPHQLYIAHEVSARFAPRVLLSDEVGLGKTIEACLVIHRLLLCGRISRVLILVPDSLVHQWFVELLRRFNLWFNIFDEHRAASAQSSAPEGNPFLDSQLILCGSSFLAKSPQRAQQAIAAGWDMLVVDEAHHLEWTPELASPAYQVVEALGKETEGLLLLTATPEQLGMESHFARLRLLDPERYSDLEAFKSESMDHKETADIVDQLAEGKELTATGIAYLERIVGKERMEAFLKDPQNGRAHLIQDLLDQHGPGRVIFRNRRSAMRKFPRRIVRLAPIPPLDAPSGWPQHVLDEVHADLRLGELKLPLSPDYSADPRLKWLLALLDATAPGKVLLICNSKEKVIALEKAIKEHSSHQVGVFHEELSLVLRDRNAAWFAEPEGALILLCSEIGSEGRNFQFAHHLVLFDLPTNPELLEQRIGRLDRIGQTEDIQIHVPYLSGTAQEALVTWYHAGLNAFEQNLEGGNRIAQAFGDELLACALQAGDASATQVLEDLVGRTREFHTALKAQLASGRDRLLEMNSFRPEIGDGLVAENRGARPACGLGKLHDGGV